MIIHVTIEGLDDASVVGGGSLSFLADRLVRNIHFVTANPATDLLRIKGTPDSLRATFEFGHRNAEDASDVEEAS